MGRARGKHTDRCPTVDVKPGTPEGEDIGLSDRQQGQGSPRVQGEGSPIPGGRDHLGNHPTPTQAVPIAVPRPEHRGMMAHGVQPGTHTPHDRADAMRGPNDTKPAPPPAAAKAARPITPVPVVIVEQGAGPAPLRIATMRRIVVPGFNADPVPLCGRDLTRSKIRLLNADAANDVRISQDLTGLVLDAAASPARSIGGALIPHAMTKYQDISTQDELWAIAQTSSTGVELELIFESELPGAGGPS